MSNYEDLHEEERFERFERLDLSEDQEGTLKLPIGFYVGGSTPIMELPIATTGSEAEIIYTKRPKQGKIHNWIAQVISASVESINGEPIASKYLAQTNKNEIPALVKQIPFLDAGTLLIEIHRECWQPVLKDQRVRCESCGSNISVDVDLYKIEIPENGTGKPLTYYTVELSKPVVLTGKVYDEDILKEFKGYKINRLKFRTATLGDALKHDGVSKDEIIFWRNIAFDTLVDLYYEDENGEVTPVPTSFLTRRGKAFWTKDLNTLALKEIRQGMQTKQPSAKAYYEEECPECGSTMKVFASVGHFFQA